MSDTISLPNVYFPEIPGMTMKNLGKIMIGKIMVLYNIYSCLFAVILTISIILYMSKYLDLKKQVIKGEVHLQSLCYLKAPSVRS